MRVCLCLLDTWYAMYSVQHLAARSGTEALPAPEVFGVRQTADRTPQSKENPRIPRAKIRKASCKGLSRVAPSCTSTSTTSPSAPPLPREHGLCQTTPCGSCKVPYPASVKASKEAEKGSAGKIGGCECNEQGQR